MSDPDWAREYDIMNTPVIDRRAAIMARMTNPLVQPDGYEALRCTEHDAFIVWVSAPAPTCTVKCPAACHD